MNNFFILTGGPGSGKTTLLNELNKNGIHTVPEEARRIIQEQIKTSGKALPWEDKTAFADLMLNASLATYLKFLHEQTSSVLLFDRGIPDTIGYMELENIPVSSEVEQIVKKHLYNRHVFILPPWKEIYENDTERKQTWQEAVLTYEKMKSTYLRFGYTIIEVPRAGIGNRKDFILERLALYFQ
ncbi:AAA family ATPase [Elizabethkingia meningoseptica]|uniref:AAA family ATPase n=1 Tax=Elizabethkingia meningoseptica TaxID=238 RepID=UPI0023B0CED3|nr:AAA family ATPase [Elizabethkingia meningoseptica]MDE5437447.1 AAA family ATPase [Elizabethkingia meningoseptica]MDE5507455.1 AAA family ATPase [Elizabethkingia meningoseptica]MDE5515263.1 AAA family ATPase [Elizabethkingia meningoseptica]MDE5529529.1 AAA family ATPase [Elizabethkingia meningoseptica]MDE5533085.1 AAA family ATPase [Elizabethkingia meningoseptica]